MKKLFATMVILFVTLVPGRMLHAEDMPFQIDGLGQFRLSQDIVERVLASREEIEASNLAIAEDEEFDSPADILRALDSSPEATAILTKHGLTSTDAMLFMAALARHG